MACAASFLALARAIAAAIDAFLGSTSGACSTSFVSTDVFSADAFARFLALARATAAEIAAFLGSISDPC